MQHELDPNLDSGLGSASGHPLRCPRIHRPAQPFGNDAKKASVQAQFDAYSDHQIRPD
jgi:hypothetical protein